MKDNYSSWDINENEFPKNESIKEQIVFLLRYGILAPSTHNTQPWKFKIQNDALYIYPDWNLRLAYADPDDHNIYISLGCCIENILCAASYFQLPYSLSIHSKSKNDSYVKIIFTKNKNNDDRNFAYLFPFITKRYSNKLSYLQKPIEETALKELANAQTENDVKIVLIDRHHLVYTISQLHRKAMLTIGKNKGFREELTSWVRTNNTTSSDGMPGFVMGFSPLQVSIGKVVLRYQFIFPILAKKDISLIQKSPAVGVIVSKNESVVSWINTGRAYERLALTATSLGINITIMAAMIQDKDSQAELAQILQLHGLNPQLFFRLGYSTNNSYHTPRRDLKINFV
ncbi:MAG: nitroreductase family protein [Candidatus Levybacteria bacterium]|nr:nitroreductase family protein [Candidatus Levybacteria bacterium]